MRKLFVDVFRNLVNPKMTPFLMKKFPHLTFLATSVKFSRDFFIVILLKTVTAEELALQYVFLQLDHKKVESSENY